MYVIDNVLAIPVRRTAERPAEGIPAPLGDPPKYPLAELCQVARTRIIFDYTALARVGLTRIAGSPVTVVAERCES